MSDFIIIIFLFPIFFMIHEFEEIIMIQKWINHNQIKLTQRFPHLYPIIKKASKIDTHKFSIIVAEEFIIVSTCCTISIYTGQIIWGVLKIVVSLKIYSWLSWQVKHYIPKKVVSSAKLQQKLNIRIFSL